MPDPRICCAAGLCCDPPAARAATISLLTEAGCDPKDAPTVADNLASMKVALFDTGVTEAMRAMVDAHNGHTKGF